MVAAAIGDCFLQTHGGTCETPVLEGIPAHRDSVLDADARQAGDCMMICVSRACTPRLVLDL